MKVDRLNQTLRSRAVTLLPLAALSLSALGLSWITPAHAACQLLQIAQIPLVMEDNEALVDGSINGHKVRFVVDTGSALTLISEPAAAELGLQAVDTGGRVYGVGGGGQLGHVTVKEIKLGTATAHNLDMPVAGPGLKSDRFAGLLGEDFLAQYDLELDFANGILRLIQPKDCNGDQVAYWAKTYSMAEIIPSASKGGVGIAVTLNGQPVRAIIDTGAVTSVVTTGAASRAGVTPKSQGVTATVGSRGAGREVVETFAAVFPTLSIGDETVKNVKLRVADLFHADKEVEIGSHIPTAVMDFPSMLLGADFVRAHRIYVARSQRKIYFTYNGGPIFQVIGDRQEAPRDAPPAKAPSTGGPTAPPKP